MAWEKLGLSRPTRSERLRVAAELGDVRHLAALLEAGADVDTVNEPRQGAWCIWSYLVHIEFGAYLILCDLERVLEIAFMCSKWTHEHFRPNLSVFVSLHAFSFQLLNVR